MFLLGFWMNVKFAFQSKEKWFNLYALRNLVKLQLTSNIFNIAIHLLLVIPWPFFGYTLNPGNFLWTIKNPVFCRLFIVVEDLISIFCSVSAVVIFGTNPKIQELGQERIRKMAFCASWCWISVGLGAMFVSSFREIVPLLKHGNCPSHPFIILCGRKEIKYLFTTFAMLSFVLFVGMQRRKSLRFPECGNHKSITNSSLKWLCISHNFCTSCVLAFVFLYIPVYIFGEPFSSAVTYNLGRHYFDVTTLALSVSLPAFWANIHASSDSSVVEWGSSRVNSIKRLGLKVATARQMTPPPWQGYGLESSFWDQRLCESTIDGNLLVDCCVTCCVTHYIKAFATYLQQ